MESAQTETQARDERDSTDDVTRVLDGDSALGAATLGDRPPRPRLEIGTHLDRFELRGSIGRGGMGEVFRAHDPKLGREIALKLLRRSADPTAEARLLREAQAMAQLNHPNILPIFDVGRHAHGLFIAMQLVDGQTLSDWLKERTRPWPEILRTFIAAGRGLAAAHEVELVHRDFKPANVMVDRRGEVHVMDFGLARAAGEVVESEGAMPTALGSVDDALTRSDALVGTPPYMAVEQHLVNSVDPRSDQYSFCVALWEGLYGVRPFTGATPVELLRAKREHRPATPKDRSVPRWLREALLRGMSPRVEDRFASMDALLDALQRGLRGSGRRRRLGWLAAGLVMGGLGVFGLLPDEPACGGARQRLSGVWDEDMAARVESAMLATDVPYAAETWQRLRPVLDAYADRWAEAHTETCQATRVHRTQPEEQMDRRMRCLDEQRRDLAVLVDALGTADASAVEQALAAAQQLPSLERCVDPEPGDAALPADPEQRDEVEALRDELAQVRVSRDLGRYEAAAERLDSIRTRAEALAHEPLLIDVMLLRGALAEKTGRYDEAVDVLTQAYFEAGRLGLERQEAEASVQLTYVVGARRLDFEEGLRWAKHAEADVERVGDERLRASLWVNIGAIHHDKDEHEQALDYYGRALKIWERELPETDSRIARVLNNIANVHKDQGRYEESLRLHQRILAQRSRSLGPNHPQLGISHNNVGTVLREMGRYDDALGAYLESTRIREYSLGKEHPLVASSYGNVGVAYGSKGDYAEALGWFQRALAIQTRLYEPPDPRIARTLNNIGNVHALQGQYEEALATYRRAQAMWEETKGEDSPSVAQSLINISTIARVMGRYDEALEAARRTYEIQRDRLGPEHPAVSRTMQSLGSIHRAQGKLDEALDAYQRGLEIARKGFGARHEEVGVLLGDIGTVQRDRGELDASVEAFEEALAIFEEVMGAEHPRVGGALTGLGQTRLARGESTAGRELLERAVSLLEAREEVRPEERADARFALARALGPTERGRALARAARADYVGSDAGNEANLEEIDRWLARP